MNLIIECDLGRDADDFFTLCYLAGTRLFNISAVTITPGDKDQVAVAKFLLKEFGINCPVGVPDNNRNKFSVTPFHHDILNAYGYPLQAEPDCLGYEAIERALKDDDDCQMFCIGPVTNVAAWLKRWREGKTEGPLGLFEATMQGGFCGYHIYRPEKALTKFDGMRSCPTFNLNGDVEGGKAFIADERFSRRFIGKNVCHSVVYDIDKYLKILKRWLPEDAIDKTVGGSIRNLFSGFNLPKPVEIFLTGSYTYFKKHSEKKFHDPAAAVCMVDIDTATWIDGKTYRDGGKWGTMPSTDKNHDRIAVDLDHDRLWDHIINFK